LTYEFIVTINASESTARILETLGEALAEGQAWQPSGRKPAPRAEAPDATGGRAA
jgi:hypothetical protein